MSFSRFNKNLSLVIHKILPLPKLLDELNIDHRSLFSPSFDPVVPFLNENWKKTEIDILH